MSTSTTSTIAIFGDIDFPTTHYDRVHTVIAEFIRNHTDATVYTIRNYGYGLHHYIDTVCSQTATSCIFVSKPSEFVFSANIHVFVHGQDYLHVINRTANRLITEGFGTAMIHVVANGEYTPHYWVRDGESA